MLALFQHTCLTERPGGEGQNWLGLGRDIRTLLLFPLLPPPLISVVSASMFQMLSHRCPHPAPALGLQHILRPIPELHAQIPSDFASTSQQPPHLVDPWAPVCLGVTGETEELI